MLVAGVVGAFAMLSWRSPLLFKLSTRNIARRRLRAALITVGLMLSTSVVGSAFVSGDTMTHTLQSLVAGSLGSVDEVILLDPPRSRFFGAIRTIAEPGIGALAGANLSFFAESEIDGVHDAARSGGPIAGIVPAIVDQVTVVDAGSQQLQSAVSLLAVPGAYPAAFGPLTTTAGAPIALEALGPDEVLVNAAAAEAFHAAAGERLAILRSGQTWNVRVRAVSGNGGLAGMEPLLIVPLAHYQHFLHQDGQVNQIIVANQGGSKSVERSEEAAQLLRSRLADRSAAQQLHKLLAAPEIQRGLLEAGRTLSPADRQRLAALRTEAVRPEMTDRFISLVADPRVRRRLFFLAARLPAGPQHMNAAGLLQRLTRLSVLDLKQQALEQAAGYGAVITTVFLVLGIFSIAAATLLIFLIFSLLAADRGSELATMRALGMRRRQIMSMFLLEGLVYDLVGAALGTAASLGAGYLIVVSLGRAIEPFGVKLDPHVEPRSLLIAFTAGVLLSLAAMLPGAWRVSRLAIVAATRGEAVGESRVASFVFGTLLLAGAAVVWWRWRVPEAAYQPRHPLIVPATLSLVLLGLIFCCLPLARRLVSRPALAGSAAPAALAGLLLAAIWVGTLAHLPTPAGETRADSVTLAAAGLVLVLAAVWSATHGLAPLLEPLDRALSPLPRLRAVVRPAARYLGQQRWRTGLTLAMFGTIIFIMVVALTLINVILNAYAGGEAPVAGYDLRADQTAGTTAVRDMEAALASTPAVSRAAFSAIGSVASEDIQIVPLGLPVARWEAGTLAIVDDGFLVGIRAGMERLAPGYSRAESSWAAVRAHPGTAVVTARMFHSIMPSASSTAGTPLAPLSIWIRPNTGGKPIKLVVIGVVDARSELDEGIYASRAGISGLGIPPTAPSAFFFAVRPGIRVQDAAEGLRVSLGTRGLTIVSLGDAQRIVSSVRLLLTRLVQSFMGLGLLAGIAALGLLGVQAVLERRQQLGTLRAIGFTGGQLRAVLAIEAAAIAAVGIALGIALGLLLARSLVAVLAATYPEVHNAVPWHEIAITASTAWAGSTIAISVAAWNAGRVSPADALRVV